MVGLRAKQAELAELREKLGAMEADLRTNTKKKERLEAEVALCSVKLERAEKLIGGFFICAFTLVCSFESRG